MSNFTYLVQVFQKSTFFPILSSTATPSFLKMKEEQIQIEYCVFLSEILFLFLMKRHYLWSALSMSYCYILSRFSLQF